MWCEPFSTNISIILKEMLGFSSSMYEGFSQGISYLSWFIDLYGWFMNMIYVADIFVRFTCGWSIYVVDIFMRFTCGWYINMWLIYEIHMCWNWLIKVLKFKLPDFAQNINMVSEHREWKSLTVCNKLILCISWRVEQNIAAMTSVSIRPKYQLEGT